MSKIDAGSIERSALQDMQRARESVKSDARKSATPEQILAEFMKMIERERVSGSGLLTLDFSQSTAQLRAIMADEMLKILQQVPGFVSPTLSRPPTPEEVKQLLKALGTAEKDGLLEKHDAFKAATAESARGSLLNPDSSPIGKQWASFLQQTTTAQQLGLKRDDAGPTTTPQGLLGQELPLKEGAGLRSPVQVGETFKGLNNKQKLDIMSAGFGRELATTLKDANVRDPAALLKKATTPELRENLAQTLGMSRGQLTVHLARAEMLSIGAGKSGEQALRPQHLPALSSANIVTIKQLALLKSVPPETFAQVFTQVRQSFSGFARAMSGERPILKKDLQHWASAAAKRKSSLLDADWEDLPRGGKGDAEEMIMSWYLEHWEQLEGQRLLNDQLPTTRHDPLRDDGLICFWVERPNYDVNRPSLTELVYICLDPTTGVIDLKSKE